MTGNGMLGAIGNTPLIRLRNVVPDGARVLLRLEYYNPTASYKDRMALAMVERAEQRGALKPGMTVVEYTGGSTGISLAFVCAVKAIAAAPPRTMRWPWSNAQHGDLRRRSPATCAAAHVHAKHHARAR